MIFYWPFIQRQWPVFTLRISYGLSSIFEVFPFWYEFINQRSLPEGEKWCHSLLPALGHLFPLALWGVNTTLIFMNTSGFFWFPLLSFSVFSFVCRVFKVIQPLKLVQKIILCIKIYMRNLKELFQFTVCYIPVDTFLFLPCESILFPKLGSDGTMRRLRYFYMRKISSILL